MTMITLKNRTKRNMQFQLPPACVCSELPAIAIEQPYITTTASGATVVAKRSAQVPPSLTIRAKSTLTVPDVVTKAPAIARLLADRRSGLTVIAQGSD